ncbi:MAG: DUF401 family protein [Sedimentisphaerales bacterium]|nr:DUF401 family protein [Sedimentisphaerales bacterium]
MYALIAMAMALVLLVMLLRLKLKLGRAMLVAAVALAILLRVSPAEFAGAVAYEWRSKPLTQTTGYLFVTLTALVLLVNMLGLAMKQTGVSARLVSALHGLFRSRRLALAAIPMMMGMLPTPGGIMLSAPMVRDLGDHVGIDRAHSAAINFFFRHQWETIWPLFPSVLFIQGMLGVSALSLISHNVAIMLMGTLGGAVFLLLWGIPPRSSQAQPKAKFHHDLRDFAHAFWPIAMVAALYAGVNLPPAAGLLPAILIFLLIHKVPSRRWGAIFKAAFEGDFVILIFGALVFKLNLEAGLAVDSAVRFLSDISVPGYLLLFFLPMFVGALTGLTLGTVAITFPLLMPFMHVGGELKLGLEVLAFSGLICGLLITPVHLCLALSASYFETSLSKIILRVLGPVFFVAGAGALTTIFFG